MSEPTLSSNLEEWHTWRRNVDSQLLAHTENIATLKAYQQIMRDNETARHSKTPQVIFGVLSVAFSFGFFILQLLAAKWGGP